ncbi:MAG: endonuclease/exonuclease/phosphatase family protein [Gammaproteobacteria bacterium]|nr:endonuclease/exonuclease/phosphatase family protein [Gammaproteobacteria bacterium]
MHKGFNASNRKFLLHDIREAIRSVNADICFLQEVVGDGLSYGRRQFADTDADSQFEFLADSIWSHFAYGKNAIVEQGHHGNAILSKYPFAVWENHDISRWQFSRRGLLYGKLENGLTLICAHLGLLARERRYQIKRLQELIETHCGPDDPVIVAGDFNDWRMRGDRVMREQLGFSEVITEMKGRPARSFPAALPVLRVDRIYFRGLHLQSARLLRSGIWRRLSDHAAINADFLVDSQLLTYAVKTR